MTKTTTNLLGIIITILAGTYFYIMYCSECGAPDEKEGPMKEVAVPATPKATSFPFAFGDRDQAYTINDNFNLNVSSSYYLDLLSQSARSGRASGLKNFLAENKSNEDNTMVFPNLGLVKTRNERTSIILK